MSLWAQLNTPAIHFRGNQETGEKTYIGKFDMGFIEDLETSNQFRDINISAGQFNAMFPKNEDLQVNDILLVDDDEYIIVALERQLNRRKNIRFGTVTKEGPRIG